MRSSLPVTSFGTSQTRHKTSWFSSFANKTANLSGKPGAFLLAAGTIIIWAITGPVFHYSDTWQLVINTGTTIVTFLMVFLIQNTQNRETLALQVKLSELILALDGARNDMASIEEAEESDLEKIKRKIKRRAQLSGTKKPKSSNSRVAA